MKMVAVVLMGISAIALILAALMGVNILRTPLLNVEGTGFLELSMACSLFAIAMRVVKPFEGEQTSV